MRTALTSAPRTLPAADVRRGDVVHLGGQTRLVVRSAADRDEVFLELWDRTAVEHSTHFLARDEPLRVTPRG